MRDAEILRSEDLGPALLRPLPRCWPGMQQASRLHTPIPPSRIQAAPTPRPWESMRPGTWRGSIKIPAG